MAELKDHFGAFDNLMNADENSEKNFDYQLLNLFISVVPRGEMFIGKNGTGLMTLAEFTNIVDEGY